MENIRNYFTEMRGIHLVYTLIRIEVSVNLKTL
jgi:hypothetical protein